MKIALASLGDPRAVGTWSGIPANITLALEKRGHEIFAIRLTPPKEPWHFSWLRRYYHRLHNKWFLAAVEVQWLRRISAQLDKEVNALKPDVVVSIHGDWLAYATFAYPACIVHDTTFASIVDYYPAFSNLSQRSLRMGNQMYQRALDKSIAAIFSADWAMQSAIAKYGTRQSKVFTIPFGANMDEVPAREDVMRWINVRSQSDRCKLLFLGIDWHRKGGPEALQFVESLNRMGIMTTLTIAGCSPDIPHAMKEYVQIEGFLKKDNLSHQERLTRIFQESHALILPSKAECYGCVYCEANAYGLPALGRDTGGVPEIIKDGTNGLLFFAHESPESFAQRWASIWLDKAAYKRISVNSYFEFTNRLNYDVFAEKLENILSGLILT